MNFEINEKNKALWDKNFVRVEGSDEVQTQDASGNWVNAEPLNNDPEIQEFGAVVDVLKYGYTNKDYKIYQLNSDKLECQVTGKPLKLYDVVMLLDGWDMFSGFVVFLGFVENEDKLLFKYYHGGSDSIRKYTPDFKNL